MWSNVFNDKSDKCCDSELFCCYKRKCDRKCNKKGLCCPVGLCCDQLPEENDKDDGISLHWLHLLEGIPIIIVIVVYLVCYRKERKKRISTRNNVKSQVNLPNYGNVPPPPPYQSVYMSPATNNKLQENVTTNYSTQSPAFSYVTSYVDQSPQH